MARSASSTINIQASSSGLTIGTGTPITLYIGPYTDNNPIPLSTLGYTTLTVQNLINGICIPSGVVPSTVNQIDVFIADICQTVETIYLEEIAGPTPTPTPTTTPTPTPTNTGSPVTNTPTPTPTSTPTPVGWYRTTWQSSFDAASCESTSPGLGPLYFNPHVTTTGNNDPKVGSQTYTDPNYTQYFGGSPGYYGVLDYNQSQAPLYVIRIDSGGLVYEVRDANCSGGGGSGTTS